MTRPIRILHVIGSLGGGGAERVLLTVLSGLSDCVQTLALANGGALLPLVPAAVPVYPCSTTAELARLMADVQPDVVQTWLDGSLLLAITPAAQVGIPVVHRMYSVPRMQKVYEPGGPGHHELMAHALAAAASVVALTPTVADEAVEFYGIARPRVIFNGLPLAGRRGCGTAVDKPAGRFVILNAGRLAPEKGQDHLLEAFARIAAEQPSADLWIAGVGKSEPKLRAIAADLGVAERVRFLGFQEDIAALHAAADLFVFPSMFEGFGNALAEALAAGLPVVASDLPVIRHDVLGGRPAALLVPPGDVDALARALAAVIADADLRVRLAAAARLAGAAFGAGRMLDEYRGLYTSLARPSRIAA